MKKLMIALAAAAAITGVAKADIDNHVTDFESLTIGNQFNAATDDQDTRGDTYWAIEEGATEPYAIVTNASFNGENRAGNALSIDTDKLLSRKVKAGDAGAESFGTAPLYFDGYVQFTAADSLPETEAGDKLVVWLYGGDADTDDAVTNALGLTESKAATNLVVTAGTINLETGDVTPTHYLISGLAIEPNSWHRLTIKALADAGLELEGVPGFKVWVDSTPVTAGATAVFPSLVKYNDSAAKTLTSVSFKGTGAVDDLGFLNEAAAPEFAKDQEAETFTLAVSRSGTGTITDVKVNGDSYTEPITATVGATLTVVVESDDTVTCAQASSALVHDEDAGTWTFTVDTTGVAAESTLTLAIVATSGEGPSDWPADPTEVAGKTAAEAFGISGDLAAADAEALATWAKAKSVDYADRTTTILTDAFLLNCANTQAAIDEAKEDFKVTSISVAADGTVTITPADGAKYGNGKVVIEGSTALPAEWHTKTSTDHFFRVKLVVDEVPVN